MLTTQREQARFEACLFVLAVDTKHSHKPMVIEVNRHILSSYPTLYHDAKVIFKRYDTQDATGRQVYLLSEKCDPPCDEGSEKLSGHIAKPFRATGIRIAKIYSGYKEDGVNIL